MLEIFPVIPFFFWCSVLNMGLLLLWFGMFAYAHDWVFQVHRKWFKHLTVEQFDAIHYAGIGFFKIFIYAVFLIPLLAFCIIS